MTASGVRLHSRPKACLSVSRMAGFDRDTCGRAFRGGRYARCIFAAEAHKSTKVLLSW